MQELYDQIQVYLNMEDEIPFKEFQSFYKKVIDFLAENAEDLDEESLWKALFVVENVISNAEGRANDTRGGEAKKYAKMASRLQLWAKNFGARLGRAGYTEDDINDRFNVMFAEGEKQHS
ncbi:hypothetical protein [Alkalicoccobacillus porphyridii]|uniref:Uncharacterized protein n=1 Tax=Alkalicoccobacillus porphyridii TaxID=2597270 RepID=A0A553ZV82_9BACI|nr:hypothetical protein [Alkalicoccobacillus porphyridii]TSB45367.1 hypothetical protein FN960_16875 [Alkalicoccobacillus porphyridii]